MSPTHRRPGVDGPTRFTRTRREVLVAGRTAPASATATRGMHLRRDAATRRRVLTLALLGGGLFLLGAATGRIFWALVGPAVVFAVLAGTSWRSATKLAERDFFIGWALAHGFNYSERMSLLETTPLLAAGDRRHCENYMEGALEELDGTSVGLAHFVYETKEVQNDRRNRPIPVFIPHRCTVAVVDLPRAMAAFPSVHLSARSRRRQRDEWLQRNTLTNVELESADLADDYELLVGRSQDRSLLLELFKPSFQVWLSRRPFPVSFEFSGGTLVVHVKKRLRDAEELDLMVEALVEIARRISKEGEPLKAVDDSHSKAPPTGVKAFPPPPPATKPAVEQPDAPKLHAVPEPQPERTYKRASIPPPSAG